MIFVYYTRTARKLSFNTYQDPCCMEWEKLWLCIFQQDLCKYQALRTESDEEIMC